MANKVIVEAKFRLQTNDFDSGPDQYNKGPVRFTVAGNIYFAGTKSCPAAETVFTMTPVTSPSWAYFENLDDTNWVEMRIGQGYQAFARLPGGGRFFLPMAPNITCAGAAATTDMYTQTAGSAVELMYCVTQA